MARVAWCYYHDGLTQNDIGERLGLPRLKISRLLEKGRQSGVKLNSYKNLDHMFAIARSESVSRLAKRIFHRWPIFS